MKCPYRTQIVRTSDGEQQYYMECYKEECPFYEEYDYFDPEVTDVLKHAEYCNKAYREA